MTLRIGTRASALAKWQAEWVATRLRSLGHDVEFVLITTQGDSTQTENEGAPIGSLGTVGVFTKELQRALRDGRIDLAVHSLKDLPTDPVEGLTLAAVPERESPFDVLISCHSQPLEALPSGATIGTGSLRRRAQLLHARPDLKMADIRGNVDTRLRKLREGPFDAIVLAEAGIRRLGLSNSITQILSADIMLPAVGQGALGIEARTDDSSLRAVLDGLNHSVTHQAVLAERTLLAAMRGGCLAPIGAYARLEANDQLRLTANVVAVDGRRRLIAEASAPGSDAIGLGQRVADELLLSGASELIAEARRT